MQPASSSATIGAQGGNRTLDLRITSALLYRLSYLGAGSNASGRPGRAHPDSRLRSRPISSGSDGRSSSSDWSSSVSFGLRSNASRAWWMRCTACTAAVGAGAGAGARARRGRCRPPRPGRCAARRCDDGAARACAVPPAACDRCRVRRWRPPGPRAAAASFAWRSASGAAAPSISAVAARRTARRRWRRCRRGGGGSRRTRPGAPSGRGRRPAPGRG